MTRIFICGKLLAVCWKYCKKCSAIMKCFKLGWKMCDMSIIIRYMPTMFWNMVKIWKTLCYPIILYKKYHTTPYHFPPSYHIVAHESPLYHTIAHWSLLYHTMPHWLPLHYTMPHWLSLYHTMPHWLSLYHTMPHWLSLYHIDHQYNTLCHHIRVFHLGRVIKHYFSRIQIFHDSTPDIYNLPCLY